MTAELAARAMELAELERALMAIKPVGSIDGHDVVRRESVRDIVQQRALAAQRAEQAQGAEPVAWAVYWKGLPAGSVPWFVSKGEPRGLHEDQYKVPLYAHAQPQAREPVAFEVWAERNGMRMDRLNSGYYCWTKEAALHSWRREHAQPQAAPNDEQLQVALGALADIAGSRDMTLQLARNKAARIYAELTKDEPK